MMTTQQTRPCDAHTYTTGYFHEDRDDHDDHDDDNDDHDGDDHDDGDRHAARSSFSSRMPILFEY